MRHRWTALVLLLGIYAGKTVADEPVTEKVNEQQRSKDAYSELKEGISLLQQEDRKQEGISILEKIGKEEKNRFRRRALIELAKYWKAMGEFEKAHLYAEKGLQGTSGMKKAFAALQYGLGNLGSLKVFGKTLDAFSVTGTKGEKLSSEPYKGKVLLIYFWDSANPECVEGEPSDVERVKRLHEKFHENGFEVLGVSLDENMEMLKHFVRKNEIPWSHCRFDTAKEKIPLVRAFDVGMWIPSGILIDSQGRVQYTKVGGQVDSPEGYIPFEDAVAKLMSAE